MADGFDYSSSKPLTNVNKLLGESCSLTAGLSSQHQLPNALRRNKKKEKQKKKYVSREVLNDLKVLRMRSVLDSKRFYKRNSLKSIASEVQVGRVIDSPADYYSSRLTKKERKRTLVDELMADQNFKSEVKRRYVDIVTNHKKKFKRDYKYLQIKQKKAAKRNKAKTKGNGKKAPAKGKSKKAPTKK